MELTTDAWRNRMLVLSRKQSERIKLGHDITVTVVRITGDKVRLGIEAPPDMLVLREELQPFVESGESPPATAPLVRSA